MNKTSVMEHIQKPRRQMIPLMFTGFLACSSGIILLSWRENPLELPLTSSDVDLSIIHGQTDDIARESPEVWPHLSQERREKVRESLIEDGMSPIQAESLLPHTQIP